MQAQLDPPRREDAGSLEQRPTPFLTLWAQKWHANQVFEDFRPQSMISSHVYKYIVVFCSLNSPNSWKPGRKLDWRAAAAPFSFSAQERAFGHGGDAIRAEQGRSEVGRRRVPGGRTAQAEGTPYTVGARAKASPRGPHGTSRRHALHSRGSGEGEPRLLHGRN
jgi:hypothetical protein